jgi:hypothetical protein
MELDGTAVVECVLWNTAVLCVALVMSVGRHKNFDHLFWVLVLRVSGLAFVMMFWLIIIALRLSS